MSDRILGRAAELQQVGALLADETPEARALVLTGDAGVGKTTIWEEGVRLAGERGLRVLAAGPAEGEAALPFAALGDLLGPVVDAIELPRPQRVALDRALQRADADEPADRLAVSRAALGLLQGLARDGPLVVAVDDVQWLDTPTEHVLAFALRRLADVPARALIARRSEGGPPPLGLQRAIAGRRRAAPGGRARRAPPRPARARPRPSAAARAPPRLRRQPVLRARDRARAAARAASTRGRCRCPRAWASCSGSGWRRSPPAPARRRSSPLPRRSRRGR